MGDRNDKMIKEKVIIVSALTLVFIIIGGYLISAKREDGLNAMKYEGMKVTFLQVGKADCILIEADDMVIMIDTGYDENGEEICEYLSKVGIERLDYLILTHSDKDHIGGADHILKQIEVNQILESSNVVDTKQYREYQELMTEKGMTGKLITENYYIDGDQMKLVIMPPKLTEYEKDNDYSLVIRAAYGETSFLFAGDAQEVRIDELLEESNLPSTVLKVPHHGRADLNSTAFLQAVSPMYAVITSDSIAKVDAEIIQTLTDLNSQILFTCEGTIVLYSDGSTIKARNAP